MPLSLKLPHKKPPVLTDQRSLEEGDLRLGRPRINTATTGIRRMFRVSVGPQKPERECSVASTGSAVDYELQELQDLLEERPSSEGWKSDRFRMLWELKDLENSLKQMLRVAGCPLRILDAVRREDNGQLSKLCGSADSDTDQLSLVEEEVGMLAGCLFGRPKLVKMLVKKGVSVMASDPEGRTALHLAAFSGNVETVKYLVKHGAKVNQWDTHQSTTPLVCAAAASSEEVLKLLLSEGADVNAGLESPDGTALHYAVRANSVPCVELLLKSGAKTSGTIPKGETPLHVAADYGFDKCLNLLLSYGAKVDLVRGTVNKTALHLAAEDGSVRCARLLLDFKANVHLRTNRGQTALHLAARAQSAELAEMLLAAGADINARDDELRTPLHCCIGKQCRSLECIKLLINHGAQINVGDQAGFTPVHLAAINEYSNCVELLMDHGGDLTLRTRAGVSCLQLIKHKTPSVLANLPERFSKAIVFYERDHVLNDKFAELKINFKPLISQSSRGECNFLKALIDIDQRHILKHPLCESFLHLKWMKVRKFLFCNMMYYLVFCVLLSIYVLGTAKGYCYNIGKALELGLCQGQTAPNLRILHEQCKITSFSSNVTCDSDHTLTPSHFDLCSCVRSRYTSTPVKHPSFYQYLWYVLVAFDVTLVFKEVFQLVQDPPQYFRNPENLAEWALMFFLVLVGTPLTGFISTWQKHLAALSVLICWFELMMLVGRWPRLGLYIHMFSKVLQDFFQFLIAYCSLGIGCAVAFVVLLPDYAPTSNPLRSLLKVVVMMTGEMEYDDMFYNSDHAVTILNPTAALVFLMFVFLITIILMNLLVGLAVSDIQGLRKTAKLGRLVRLTEQIAHIEGTLFSKVLTRLLPNRVCAWIADAALVSPFAYRYTLVLRPNDPNDRRLTPDIMEAACRVAKSRVKRAAQQQHAPLARELSMMSYDYELVQSLQNGSLGDDDVCASFPVSEVSQRESKLKSLEEKVGAAEKMLSVLLAEVRTISSTLTPLAEAQRLASGSDLGDTPTQAVVEPLVEGRADMREEEYGQGEDPRDGQQEESADHPESGADDVDGDPAAHGTRDSEA